MTKKYEFTAREKIQSSAMVTMIFLGGMLLGVLI